MMEQTRQEIRPAADGVTVLSSVRELRGTWQTDGSAVAVAAGSAPSPSALNNGDPPSLMLWGIEESNAASNGTRKTATW